MSVNGFAGPWRASQLVDRLAEGAPDQRAGCVTLFQQKVGAPVGKVPRRRSVYPDQGYGGAINLDNLKPVHHGSTTYPINHQCGSVFLRPAGDDASTGWPKLIT